MARKSIEAVARVLLAIDLSVGSELIKRVKETFWPGCTRFVRYANRHKVEMCCDNSTNATLEQTVLATFAGVKGSTQTQSATLDKMI
eukprot:5609273-Amphidinium_carterae.1